MPKRSAAGFNARIKCLKWAQMATELTSARGGGGVSDGATRWRCGLRGPPGGTVRAFPGSPPTGSAPKDAGGGRGRRKTGGMGSDPFPPISRPRSVRGVAWYGTQGGAQRAEKETT